MYFGIFLIAVCFDDVIRYSGIPDTVDGIAHSQISKSGRHIVTVAESGLLSVWDPKSKKIVAQCRCDYNYPKGFVGARYSYLGAMCACVDTSLNESVYFCNHKGVYFWNWKNQKPPVLIYDSADIIIGKSDAFGVLEMAISQDNHWLSFIYHNGDLTDGSTLVCLDLQEKKLSRFSTRKTLFDKWYASLSFVEDSKLLFNDGDCVRILDIKKNAISGFLSHAKNKANEIQMFSLAATGNIIVTSHKNGQIRLWDMKTRKSEVFITRNSHPQKIAISKNDRLIAIEDDRGAITIYGVQNKKAIFRTPGIKSCRTSIGFSSDDTLFATGEYPEVRFFSFAEKKTK